MWQRSICYLLLFFCILECVACSARTLLMRNARFFFIQGADEYFDLDRSQEAELGRIFDRQVIVFRSELLPELRMLADDSIKFFTESNTPGHLKNVLASVDDVRRKLILRALDDIAGFYTSIRTEQINHFEAKLNEANRDLIEEQDLDDKDYFQAKRTKLKKSLERWFGHFEEKEIVMLSEFTAHKDWGQRNLAARISFQKNLIAAMRRAQNSKAAHKRWLEQLAHQQEQFYGEQFQDLLSERKDRFIKMMSRINEVVKEGNREHFKNQVISLKEDLNRI